MQRKANQANLCSRKNKRMALRSDHDGAPTEDSKDKMHGIWNSEMMVNSSVVATAASVGTWLTENGDHFKPDKACTIFTSAQPTTSNQ